MKRTSGKIKDFVEPQAFEGLQDYANDPEQALAAYKFTDATSDLLAHWLNVLADLTPEFGAARALAGLRGVGKSHALAAFSALAALPNLRATISDSHVFTSARRLRDRPYSIVRVERGTKSTLREEMAIGFAASLGGDGVKWSGDPPELLAVAASMTRGPFVVVIDTAFEHADRVQRDDGPLLAEISKATKSVGGFLGLALDDDIEGADGANVALAGTYQIDYLDPEHLYRIADNYLFRKSERSRSALHGIYVTLRETIPGFNWAEPRFASIYPLHPAVADVAPAVRLYVPTFAFLAFAAAAGAKVGNRPALSLVALDEVFDQTEIGLRKSEYLREALVTFDELSLHTVSDLPVMQRLHARLVLKGLFMLSLDGRGATARELAAAMLLYDETLPAEASIERVEQVLALLAEATPGGVVRQPEGRERLRYRFKIQSAAPTDSALGAAPLLVRPEIAEVATLQRQEGQSPDEDRLRQWIAGITGNEISGSLADPQVHEEIRAKLILWLEDWNVQPVPDKIEDMPEEGLTARVWDVTVAVRKSFVAAAEAVDATIANQLSLEHGLKLVANAFDQSPELFVERSQQLQELRRFSSVVLKRQEVRAYVSLADATGTDEIDKARAELLALVNDTHSLSNDEESIRFEEIWNAFHSRYIEHYTTLHEATVGSVADRGTLDSLTRNEEWRDFESLAELSVVNGRYWEEATYLLRVARRARCKLPVREILLKRPYCECSFKLSQASSLSRIPLELSQIVQAGRTAYRRTLASLKNQLALSLDALSRNETEPAAAKHASSLFTAFQQETLPAVFSHADAALIERALQGMAAPPPVRLYLPSDEYGLLPREELRARLNQWLDDAPDQPALVELLARQPM